MYLVFSCRFQKNLKSQTRRVERFLLGVVKAGVDGGLASQEGWDERRREVRVKEGFEEVLNGVVNGMRRWTRALSRLAALPRNRANKSDCPSPNTRPDTQPPSRTHNTESPENQPRLLSVHSEKNRQLNEEQEHGSVLQRRVAMRCGVVTWRGSV